MRKRVLNAIYMRDAQVSNIITETSEALGCYITLKSITKVKNAIWRWCNGNYNCIQNDGYFILEYTPMAQNYNVRAFIDSKHRILGYYFDITRQNFVDEEDNICYDDLYLDVVLELPPLTGNVHFISLDDEKELAEARQQNKIDDEAVELAYSTAKKLMQQLKNHENMFVNRGLLDFERLLKL